jgi:signal transduction histidine kinase
MKIFFRFFLLILLLPVRCLASDSTEVIFIKSLPAEGILLDKGWKFQAGDNPQWAAPGFDDSKWESINPTLDLHDLPQIKKEPVGWFRIHLHIDSSHLNKPLSCIIYQSIASEIYLDGKLIASYGYIDTVNNKKTRAYRTDNSPLGLLFRKPDEEIAVRFSVQNGLLLTASNRQYNAFSFRLIDVSNISKYLDLDQHQSLEVLLLAGIFIALALIHLGIFLQFKNRKADLYFSLAMIAEAIAILFSRLPFNGGQPISFIAYEFTIAMILLIPVYTFFLYLAVWNLFPLKTKILHWTVITLIIVGIILFFNFYKFGLSFGISLSFLVTVILSILLAAKAYIKGRKEALTIIIGFSIYLITYSAFILFFSGIVNDFDLRIYFNFSLMDSLYFINTISIPFSLSLFLARDFASASRNLQQKFEEVQFLSQKTLDQEKEKQEILSSQNQVLENQVAERTAELNQSFQELKSTQKQLIQSEKMASLGELTAGIAHEIQNPLNFVNNFSEINTELVSELEEEAKKGNIEEIKSIARNIRENEEKINQHGKRADAIVKGMLQHSKASTGKKELTDITALADEYLRLSYHGMRAKDKSFNATLQTDFDTRTEKINVIPQDIGRVLLNLYNNSFYAVSERKKQSGENYQPMVSVTTQKLNDKIEIRVKDNGHGIPQKVLDKIFQPFFTTKPTGVGTGLGLSLAYDIIKAHGGEIRVETKEGQGTNMIIVLPLI